MSDTETISRDFDRIARLTDRGEPEWDHNLHYHSLLLRHLPTCCGKAADVGCGTGAFTRQLAARFDHVIGLDLSAEMLAVASKRAAGLKNIRYVQTDVMKDPLQAGQYDCIASIATVHHLSMAEFILQAKGALKPGGVLMILDLYRREQVTDLLYAAAAVPVNFFIRLAKTGRFGETAEAKRAWREHVVHDSYMSIAEIRQLAERLLPGAELQRQLLWRYSLIWRKPV